MDELSAIVRHPVFWTKTYDFSQTLRDALGVDEDALDAFDELAEPHIREETPDEDDEDFVVRLLSIPVYLPGGYIWVVELYDNGDDAGVTHYLSGDDLSERVALGRLDAHPQSSPLRWPDLLKIVDAAARDELNRASGVADFALLMLFPVVRVPEDSVAEARATVERAWVASGLVTAESASTIAKRIRASPDHIDEDEDEDCDGKADVVARLLATLAR